jgi:hypothetical protein
MKLKGMKDAAIILNLLITTGIIILPSVVLTGHAQQNYFQMSVKDESIYTCTLK